LDFLRHTFAVHRVLAWYREGKDVNSLLPVLATYMGHVNISSTQIYLQATAELLEQGNQRFFAYFHKNIKTGGSYEYTPLILQ
jgi:integrase/recombinase XerD